MRGSNARIDEALDYIDRVNGFLRQGIGEKSAFEETVSKLKGMFGANG